MIWRSPNPDHREGVDLEPSIIEAFEIERYLGDWYEVARLENRFERGLDRVTAQYKMGDRGKIEVVNRGYNILRGEWQQARGRARLTDKEGRLEVSFFLWFYSAYNILELDEEYRWALVGSSTPKYLWILSRTPELDGDTLSHILQLAQRRGYPIEELYYPTHL